MREHLAQRDNWQKYANVGGSGREETANKILVTYLTGNVNYVVTEKPKHLAHIYGQKWGIVPDLSIEYKPTGRIAFFESKRQGSGGNAHERVCKYFAPGILDRSVPIAGFLNPFFFIFMNGLTHDPKKRAEIIAWFDRDGFRDRYILWQDREVKTLIDWFNLVIRKYLESIIPI
jgi:hypothetical protein